MNITFTRGDTETIKFQIKNKNGNIITTSDINTLFITCKKSTNNKSPILFQKTLNDITLENNYYHVVFNPEDTEKLEYGKYYFDIEVTLNSGYRKTSLNTFTLTEETTLHKGV